MQRVLLLMGLSWTLLAETPAPRKLELFLLIGQSNMAGRGVTEAADREVIAGIYVQAQDLSWKPAVDPLHYDKPDIAAGGLGRAFAQTLLAARPGVSIGLIPAAFGGSALDEWKPGARHYEEAVRRTKAALRDGTLRGILWHQGESDSKDETLARSYGQRFDAFIARLRTDLGAEAPVVVGELGRFFRNRPNDAARFVDVVNRQLAQVPEKTPRAAFVSSEGLADKGDSTHFDMPSLRLFGVRYAAEFLRLDPGWAAKR